MSQTTHEKKRAFVEDLGLFLESMGLPPTAGRIWGWLLVCHPPHQSAAELAEAVGASLGAISTMTRLLIQLGIIERIGLPGERSRYYRVTSEGFAELLKAKLKLTTEIRRITERGLELLGDQPPEVRKRLQEYRDFYVFFEEEFPALIERWEQSRERKHA
ncbi:MAG: MarR family transcriptional regulator [Candidatus Hydrogenedentes bacterium]|nr:MarR family transcriptional regulator [Candidatus Hydrogenedentota bacterium]